MIQTGQVGPNTGWVVGHGRKWPSPFVITSTSSHVRFSSSLAKRFGDNDNATMATEKRSSEIWSCGTFEPYGNKNLEPQTSSLVIYDTLVNSLSKVNVSFLLDNPRENSMLQSGLEKHDFIQKYERWDALSRSNPGEWVARRQPHHWANASVLTPSIFLERGQLALWSIQARPTLVRWFRTGMAELWDPVVATVCESDATVLLYAGIL